jgi:uncharacterized protein
MPTMTAYASGTFCWPELGTTDTKAALAFYTALFDWTTSEMPLPGGGAYIMLKKDGKDVGAAYALMDDMVKQGVPPNWMSYVSVDDVDATIARVKAAKGTVVTGPMDVKPDGNMLIGRMAVIQDTEGATFSLWQPGIHVGAALVNEPGSLVWNELWSRNVDAAKKFYAAALGWGMSEMDMGGGRKYTIVTVGERQNGGIMQAPPDVPAPPSWVTYFAVDDTDKRVAKAKAAGGKVLAEPMDIPKVGCMAVIQDPQGAVFAILKLTPA